MMFVPESPGFFLCRGKTKEAVHISNAITTNKGYRGGVDTILFTPSRKKRRGPSCRAKGVIRLHETVETSAALAEDNFLREIWISLAGIKQVFANGMYRRTIPLQLTYFSH